MSFINPSCKVITADPRTPDDWAAHWNASGLRAAELPSAKPQWKRVEYYKGFSTDRAFIERVALLSADAERVLVLLDSDHSLGTVKAELEALHRFVTPGSYIIVEDTYSTIKPGVAAKAFVASHADFVSDAGREYLMFSQHRGGYLRRLC